MLKEVEDVRREVELYRVLHHPQIVRYHGSKEVNKKLLIFMEYLAGVSRLCQTLTYSRHH